MALSVRRAKRQMTPVESVPVTAPDGQPIARPGDLDLSMYFAGMRVKRVTVSDDGMILIGFGKPPAGWWRACDTGRRIICRGQVADLTVWSAPKPGVAIDRAYTQALTAVMETWRCRKP